MGKIATHLLPINSDATLQQRIYIYIQRVLDDFIESMVYFMPYLISETYVRPDILMEFPITFVFCVCVCMCRRKVGRPIYRAQFWQYFTFSIISHIFSV